MFMYWQHRQALCEKWIPYCCQAILGLVDFVVDRLTLTVRLKFEVVSICTIKCNWMIISMWTGADAVQILVTYCKFSS